MNFFFAYKIASILSWPCRLVGIDIGIDAQIEVMNSKQESLGQFIAFQIKATADSNKSRIYVERKNFEYWRQLDLPVYVALIDLKKEKVYLHFIDRSKHYHVTRDGVRIYFNLNNDEFSAESKKEFCNKSQSAVVLHIDKILKSINNGARLIERRMEEIDVNPSGDDIRNLVEGRLDLGGKLEEARALTNVLQVRVEEFAKAEKRFRKACARLQDIVADYNMTECWDWDGLLGRFTEEDYQALST